MPAETQQLIQAQLEARFGIHYNAANERLYRRLKFAFDLVGLTAGSAAFGGVVSGSAALAAFSGLTIAILAIVNCLVSFGECAARHNEAYRRFIQLDCRSNELTAQQIRSEISTIRADAPHGVQALNPIAYNRTLRSNGYIDNLQPLNRWERFIGSIG